MALTALGIKSLKKVGRHADGRYGLYLQINKSGAKSWIFRFTFDGKRKEMGLGSLDHLSLADARRKALELSCKVKQDKSFNPIQERNKEKVAQIALLHRDIHTFESCMNEYIKLNSGSWKNEKYKKQWRNTLVTYALPFIGDLAIDVVDTNHIKALLIPIWGTKTVTAKHVRNRVEQVLDFAKACGYRSGENPARWRGHLDKILPNPSSIAKVKHFEAMPFKDMPSFMLKLKQANYTSSLALEVLILTASRSNPILMMKWDEIDFAAKTWTSPAHNMKSGKPHTTPLCSRAMEIINHLYKHRMSDFVFHTGTSRNGNLSVNTMAKTLKQLTGGSIYTVHGFRSSFRDWTSEMTSTPNFIAEQALAHSIKDGTEKAYRRGDLLDKRCVLMNEWEVFLLS